MRRSVVISSWSWVRESRAAAVLFLTFKLHRKSAQHRYVRAWSSCARLNVMRPGPSPLLPGITKVAGYGFGPAGSFVFEARG